MDQTEKRFSEKKCLYEMYIDGDRQLITLDRYDLINGNIWDHLAEIGAFIFVYHVDEPFVEKYRSLVTEFSKRLVDRYPEHIDIWSDLIAMYNFRIIRRS